MPKYRVVHTWDVTAGDPEEALEVLNLAYGPDSADQADQVRAISLSVNEWLDGWNILREEHDGE